MRKKTRAEVERVARRVAREVAEGQSNAFPADSDMLARSERWAEQAAAEAVNRLLKEERSQQAQLRLTVERSARIAERCQRTLDEAPGERERAPAETREEILAYAREMVDKIVAETVPPVIRVERAGAEPTELRSLSHEVLPDVLLVLKAGCHAFLVGPAGTGKSKLAQQAAEVLGLEFQALSLGPTTPMSKVFGYYDAHGQYHGTPFRRAFEHGGLMLLDELDSGHPGLLAELNQALSLGVCAFADDMVTAHPDFRLIATGNTYGTGPDRQYVGRQALDAATLDRFVIVDVPVDERLEELLAMAQAPIHRVETRQVLEKVRQLRATAQEKRLPVMFSPRASIDSAKLLSAGATLEQALQWRVLRGVSQAHRSALGVEG